MKGKEVSSIFKSASKAAVRRAFNNGISITVKNGKRIVEKSADGTEKTVVELDKAFTRTTRKRYRIER